MARTSLPHTNISRAGVAPGAEVNGDVANGHTTVNDGRVLILARNSNGASTARTITFRLPGTVDGQSVTSRAVSIPAGASRYFGPFPTSVYPGKVEIDVDNAELKLTAYHLS